MISVKAKMREIFDKEIMERDALNRIKWDPNLNPEEFYICYRDGDEIKEVNFSEIGIEGDFIRIGSKQIPMHRIRLIKWKNEVVWNRRRHPL
ncbi:MAG: hypothetical protein DRO94_03035 [Candidatus Altiarchaeales archaeon]|nr:MAG: hypothetical protein DRO95_03325 [Candidatus Altiarchaeales archaeon]RLI94353.1 MAG: hypothetical protein DRO94_03035 [Candidatus Altiarchaeales archaeon]